MQRVGEVATTWPTVGFTALLAFCLVWWILSLVVSGLDGGDGTDGHSAHAGPVGHGHVAHGHVAHGHVAHSGHGHVARSGRGASGRSEGRSGKHHTIRRLSQTIGIGSVPLTLGLMFFALGAWSSSLLLQLLVLDRTAGLASVTAALVIGGVAVWAGVLFTRRIAVLCAPIFDFHGGPTRSEATGATVKVRTMHVDEHFGEAEVLNGPRVHSIVRVRAKAGEFTRGDVAMIVDYNDGLDTFTLVPLDEILRDGYWGAGP